MNLDFALRLYQYNNSKEISIEENKRRYRRLVKFCHPDSGNSVVYTIDDIRKAKELLDSYYDIKSVYSNKVNDVLVIDFDTLFKLYRLRECEFNGMKLYRNDLKTKIVLILLYYTISIDGIKENRNCYLKHDLRDNYEIHIDVPVVNKQERDIEISVLGVNKKFRFGNNNLSVKFNLDCNVEVVVKLYKKIHDNE